MQLALFFALFLSPGNSFVSSWCDHSMLASFLGISCSQGAQQQTRRLLLLALLLLIERTQR